MHRTFSNHTEAYKDASWKLFLRQTFFSNGKVQNVKCDGLLSTCLQHEINHLDGKLIIDHLSKLKRDLIIKKISKTKKNPDRIVV